MGADFYRGRSGEPGQVPSPDSAGKFGADPEQRRQRLPESYWKTTVHKITHNRHQGIEFNHL